MYVLSYCMAFAVHQNLKLSRIVTFPNFQQKENEIFDLRHLNDKMLKHRD